MKTVNRQPDINIGRLIEKIGPLNNQIRNSDGYKKISLMWDVGDILCQEGVKHIHPVAWAVQDKSYITRDLLSYCFRIRKKWPSKQKLEKLFGHVRSYSAFREALPLIENKKFILSKGDVDDIVRWLNDADPRLVKEKLVQMKRKYVQIRNDRRQRLKEVRDEAIIISNFHKYLVELVQKEDAKHIQKIIAEVGAERLLLLSQMCMALASDDYRGPTHIDIQNLPELFRNFADKLLPVSLAKKEKKARLRRLTRTDNIIEISDILNSMRMGEPIESIKKRLGLVNE